MLMPILAKALGRGDSQSKVRDAVALAEDGSWIVESQLPGHPVQCPSCSPFATSIARLLFPSPSSSEYELCVVQSASLDWPTSE